ncbi:MAG: hypothetical protein HY315_00030 [Acidobacteria bacterium]|nr:hypothetical protein [Acidobacteriota bacterium]
MKTVFTSVLVLALVGVPNLGLQAEPNSQQQKAAQKPAQKPPRELGKPQTKEEYDAYVAITQANDPQQRAQLCEKYLQDFPDSGLTPYLHQIAATTYQQLNNFEKLSEHGEATLKELPDNPVILTILTNAYAERGKPDLALERADKALPAISALQPPAGMDVALFNKEKNNLLATVYSSRGVAFLGKATDARAQKEAEPKPEGESGGEEKKEDPDPNLEAATGEFNKALELNPKDDYSYFRLGIIFTLKNDAENAIDAYAKAVAVGGSVAGMAKENLEKVYKLTHKDSLDGLDQRIDKAKESLNASAPPAAGADTAGSPSQPPGQ